MLFYHHPGRIEDVSILTAWNSGMVRPEVYKTYLSATSYWLFGINAACIASDQLSESLSY